MEIVETGEGSWRVGGRRSRRRKMEGWSHDGGGGRWRSRVVEARKGRDRRSKRRRRSSKQEKEDGGLELSTEEKSGSHQWKRRKVEVEIRGLRRKSASFYRGISVKKISIPG